MTSLFCTLSPQHFCVYSVQFKPSFYTTGVYIYVYNPMSQDGGISLMMGYPFQMNSSSVGSHVCHVNKQLGSYSAP